MPRKAAAAEGGAESEPRRSSRIKDLPKAPEAAPKKAPAKPRAKEPKDKDAADGEKKEKPKRGRKRKEPAADEKEEANGDAAEGDEAAAEEEGAEPAAKKVCRLSMGCDKASEANVVPQAKPASKAAPASKPASKAKPASKPASRASVKPASRANSKKPASKVLSAFSASFLTYLYDSTTLLAAAMPLADNDCRPTHRHPRAHPLRWARPSQRSPRRRPLPLRRFVASLPRPSLPLLSSP
jgi:hypothetical protein